MIVVLPVRLLIEQHGDRTFAEVLARLKCKSCRQAPAPVYLVAGHQRTFCYGGPPDWSLELVPPPRK